MKKRMKMIITLLLTVTILFGMVGCGNKRDSMEQENIGMYDYDAIEDGERAERAVTEAALAPEGNAMDAKVLNEESNADLANTAPAQGAEETGVGTGVTNPNQKLIKTYHLHYETETFDEAYQILEKQIKAYGGYAENSNLWGDTWRTLDITVKIPVGQSDAFLAQIKGLGTLMSKSENAQDVTLSYTDTQNRIQSLKTEQKRLDELLEKADSLETIIALEQRMTQVRYELQNHQSQLNLYDSLIDYSTVNITLSEVKYTVEPADKESVWSRIKTGLTTSFRDIKEGGTNFFVGLVVMLPHLLVLALILFIIYLIIKGITKRIIKKVKKQEEKRKQLAGMQQEEKENRKDIPLKAETEDKKSKDN